ncbi:hypothetical protein [Streptomyces sp. KLOTTS4A1]|uniref:hypothetical protein n=1 Tax=Streptomyces sp. KLOTTS4A1 TaxID=3390996 RepID=UPI0039F528F7
MHHKVPSPDAPTAEHAAARKFVDRHFPAVAKFLAHDGQAAEQPAPPQLDLPQLAEAMPDAVRVAMQQVLPDRYTPELAEKIAADVLAELAGTPTNGQPDTGCTALDGQCLGEDCQDRREPIHRGPEHGMRVSFTGEPLLLFELKQWGDDAPMLSFYSDGLWPDLDLAQVDELLLALDEYTGVLRVGREHLAAALDQQRAEGER